MYCHAKDFAPFQYKLHLPKISLHWVFSSFFSSFCCFISLAMMVNKKNNLTRIFFFSSRHLSQTASCHNAATWYPCPRQAQHPPCRPHLSPWKWRHLEVFRPLFSPRLRQRLQRRSVLFWHHLPARSKPVIQVYMFPPNWVKTFLSLVTPRRVKRFSALVTSCPVKTFSVVVLLQKRK